MGVMYEQEKERLRALKDRGGHFPVYAPGEDDPVNVELTAIGEIIGLGKSAIARWVLETVLLDKEGPDWKALANEGRAKVQRAMQEAREDRQKAEQAARVLGFEGGAEYERVVNSFIARLRRARGQE